MNHHYREDESEESGIREIGANESLLDEEERLLNTPISGGTGGVTGGEVVPVPSRKGKVTSASTARERQRERREHQRIRPAYDHIEALIQKAIIDGDEESVIIDLDRYMLQEEDIGRIRDAYATEGWKVETGAEKFALTFSLPG